MGISVNDLKNEIKNNHLENKSFNTSKLTINELNNLSKCGFISGDDLFKHLFNKWHKLIKDISRKNVNQHLRIGHLVNAIEGLN